MEIIKPQLTESLKFTKRTFRTETEAAEFDVLVVDRHDLWVAARDLSTTYNMPIVGSQKTRSFPLQGVSLRDWEHIEAIHTIPELKEDESDPEANSKIRIEHERKKAAAILRKQCAVFEKSTGKSIPGDTIDEKVNFLSQRNPGEIEALWNYIYLSMCSMTDGGLMQSYNTLAAKSERDNSEILSFGSFEDWTTACETQYIFRMQRPFEKYIIEFPLRAISEEQKQAIEAETREPEAPRVPKRDPRTKRFDPTQLVPNLQDPAWLQSMRAINQKRTAMFFSACLTFNIPGDNWQDKYAWISEKLVGDVIRVKRFIEHEIVNIGSRYDFFTLD